jgi:hypothetical protein
VESFDDDGDRDILASTLTFLQTVMDDAHVPRAMAPKFSQNFHLFIRSAAMTTAAHSRYLLAHLNYARLRAPLNHPDMAEFALAIAPINAIAKSTPGFVWSFDNDDPKFRESVDCLKHDELLMPQLSLWTNLDSLRHFAFKSGHAMYYKRKQEWFTAPPKPFAVCWWRPADLNPPDLKEAFDRLEYLRVNGPSETAFTFATAVDYPEPSVEGNKHD